MGQQPIVNQHSSPADKIALFRALFRGREDVYPHRREYGPIFYARSAFVEVLKKSGIPYVKDVMRHTFGTMPWAMHRNEGETAITRWATRSKP